MATVAEQLRSAREAQNLDIYQVAEITKMKTDHIRALESGEYDGFAAPIFDSKINISLGGLTVASVNARDLASGKHSLRIQWSKEIASRLNSGEHKISLWLTEGVRCANIGTWNSETRENVLGTIEVV